MHSLFLSFFLDLSILEDETTMLCQNVKNWLASDAALFPIRTETSPKCSQSRKTLMYGLVSDVMGFNVDLFIIFLYMILIRRMKDIYICKCLPISVFSEALN